MELVNSGQNFSLANITMEFLMRNKDSNLNNCYSYSLDGHLQSSEQSCNISMTNFFFQNISKAKNREVPFMMPQNIKRKFENFTKYINSKDNSLLKETMEHWNEMSSHCSEFLSSSKGYSDDSNSIASYLIGGFVGSKSQMNNDKHKLSYDLGGAIFKILHDCKCDKTYDKLREEKRFETNRSGKKSKSKDLNGFLQDVFWNHLINKNNDIETEPNRETRDYLHENNISTFNQTEFQDDNNKNCSKLITEQIKCDIKPSLTAESTRGMEMNEVDDDNKCLNTSIVGLTDDTEVQISNCGDIEGQSSANYHPTDMLNQPNKELLESDQKSDPTILNSLARASCLSLGIRRRQFSECSVESTDSESFIVFDDKCYEEHQNSVSYESENDESDYYFEEDDTYENEDEDDDECCWIEITDECDNGVEDREVAEANARWSEVYKDVAKDKCEGRVRFKDEVTIHRMVAWDYAYRAARPGPWEQMAHDRGRFKERIQRLSAVISPILLDHHRKSVYNKLYA